jgi:hypothetical protein
VSSSITVPITINGVHSYWYFDVCSDKVLKYTYYFNYDDEYDKFNRLLLISGLEYEVENRYFRRYTVCFRCTSDIDRYFDIMSMVRGIKYICVDRELLMEYFGE